MGCSEGKSRLSAEFRKTDLDFGVIILEIKSTVFYGQINRIITIIGDDQINRVAPVWAIHKFFLLAVPIKFYPINIFHVVEKDVL